MVIVGASLAGVRAAETLRQEGFDGRVVVIGAEPHRPYDRPPLSKKFLAGEWDADRIGLRKPEMLDALDIDWHLGVRATGLDLERRTVRTEGGGEQGFDGLVIATGGAARRLTDQPDLDGVHLLRTLDDAERLRRRIGPGAHLVVIGAGFIGLEAAATARQAGASVTVLEGLAAPLERALGTRMGAAIAAGHERNGVTIRCGVRIAGIVGTTQVTGVELDDGDIVPADAVLVGIGVAPCTEWLADSGLRVDNGVVCDEFLGAGIPGVFAAGDVARWPNRPFVDVEPLMRVEHWTNAAEQGAHAARNLLAQGRGDDPEPYEAAPFFWSDQFDMRIQFLGRAIPGARVDVVAGDPSQQRWCATYSVEGRLTGVLGVSMPKLVMPSRTLVLSRTPLDEALAHFEAAQSA